MTALISTAGGVLISWITVKSKQVVDRRRGAPADRMEQMFNGYERLIKQKDIEDERKSQAISRLEQNVDELEAQLEHTKDLLETTRDELRVSKKENVELKRALDELRAEYKRGKHK